jgi:hypothetical protein
MSMAGRRFRAAEHHNCLVRQVARRRLAPGRRPDNHGLTKHRPAGRPARGAEIGTEKGILRVIKRGTGGQKIATPCVAACAVFQARGAPSSRAPFAPTTSRGQFQTKSADLNFSLRPVLCQSTPPSGVPTRRLAQYSERVLCHDTSSAIGTPLWSAQCCLVPPPDGSHSKISSPNCSGESASAASPDHDS